MAFAAWCPSMFGIIISIKIKSYVPRGWFLNKFTTSFPSDARVTVIPASSSIIVASSAFRSLSSAIRTWIPVKSLCRCCFCSDWITCSVNSSGISTVNVEPTPFLLSTAIEPPIISTYFFVMAIPRPVPLYWVLALASSSCENGSNNFFWNSSLMPIPLSRTT